MVEATTGWLETYPVPHVTAQNTILGLEKQILWRHSTPERIESDNGTHFKNSLINTWAREHGIDYIQRIVVNGSESRWPSVTSGAPQGSALGPVLFNIFINDIDKGCRCTLSKFADDTKPSGAVDTPEGWDAIQRNPDKLKEWAGGNAMSFNRSKCKVLQLGQGNPCINRRLGKEQIQSSPAKKDLGCMRGWT
ncbi:hypothetical protein DUI87_12964 [Hirundo rustica rustica]|uniref:Integrase catalytic domain-containing protein n=1 Tax=Hirundo rustica rustica TaxID=333673 RepID=A0A3M0KAQ7_HIRRU|nr:hypothetical protein DUI87_12964 [Hirundo rustica rustica]